MCEDQDGVRVWDVKMTFDGQEETRSWHWGSGVCEAFWQLGKGLQGWCEVTRWLARYMGCVNLCMKWILISRSYLLPNVRMCSGQTYSSDGVWCMDLA
jgi:hypothetical protein